MLTKSEVQDLALNDLFTFAKLVNPNRLYGEIHQKVFKFLSDEIHEDLNRLLLLPRGHMKSHCIAVWAAWYITRNPEATILYISATSQLAEDQLFAIKGILTSKVYKRYWPEMLHVEEGKREKWAATAISVDHPKRTEEMVRDATIRTAGLTTNTTGWHADIVLADDVVVPENAYTEEGRRKCSASMSQLSSIKNAGGMIKACGTRYHPSDQYEIWKKQREMLYNEDDEEIGDRAIWEIMEEVVEADGLFLWPRESRTDGKRFGFNRKVLARIYGEYNDKIQYYAQYYNNPNDPGSARITKDKFQYYDKKYLEDRGGRWFFKDQPMNVYAAIDFAFSLRATADYTAVVVIGATPDGDIYVLDVERLKTDKMSGYFNLLLRLHSKWGFRRLRAEVTAAQTIIVRDLKQKFKEEGMRLSVDEHRPTRKDGNKAERISAALDHRYENYGVWHYRGGFCQQLEEELILARPPHDDIKDAFASAVEVIVKPKVSRKSRGTSNVIQFNRRFGGVS
jgi:predicted phage terminase large subunit-like protein